MLVERPLWSLYAEGVLWAQTVGQKLRELCALCERKISPRLSSVFFLSQKNTEEQNTQGFTETLSQPITQNLTAIFGSYALWYLYAGGLLWVRNCAQKGSVKSVSSVREKTFTKYTSRPIGVTSHTTEGEATIYLYRWKRYNGDDTLMFLREERLFGKLFYPNFRIEYLAFYHKEEILKYVFLSFLSSKITT